MARPLRIDHHGAVHHVTVLGNARMLSIFADDADRACFLALLEELLKPFNRRCYAYCLMWNHYHLLVETVDANLSPGMRHINEVHTQYYKLRHQRVGHLLQGKFKAILVECIGVNSRIFPC